MRIPTLRGLIGRRVLVNYRVDAEVLGSLLPAPFRPHLAHGFGIAGICLIRLENIRAKFMPAFVGISSENAAHRIAVAWDTPEGTRTGVFIPRRDTSSRINVFAGGRFFPGVHHHSRFDVRESATEFHVSMHNVDRSVHVSVDGHTTHELPPDSIFPSVADVSRFFEAGSLGYSPQSTPGQFDGMELRTFNWNVEPLAITEVSSSLFQNRSLFPAGSVTLDNALLMRGVEHEWQGRESLCAPCG